MKKEPFSCTKCGNVRHFLKGHVYPEEDYKCCDRIMEKVILESEQVEQEEQTTGCHCPFCCYHRRKD